MSVEAMKYLSWVALLISAYALLYGPWKMRHGGSVVDLVRWGITALYAAITGWSGLILYTLHSHHGGWIDLLDAFLK